MITGLASKCNGKKFLEEWIAGRKNPYPLSHENCEVQQSQSFITCCVEYGHLQFAIAKDVTPKIAANGNQIRQLIYDSVQSYFRIYCENRQLVGKNNRKPKNLYEYCEKLTVVVNPADDMPLMTIDKEIQQDSTKGI